MSSKTPSSLSLTQARSDEGQIHLPDIGVGTSRTTGTYIALLLQLENDKEVQASIIADVCEKLGIPLEKVIEYRDWEKAGGWIQEHTDEDVPPPEF